MRDLGFSERWGEPSLQIEKDTLTGKISYAGQWVAMGTMVYKHETACDDPVECAAKLAKTTANLKLPPCVTGGSRIAELVAFELTNITVKGFWRGRARRHLVPHVNAPVADLPVRRIIEGQHIIADPDRI